MSGRILINHDAIKQQVAAAVHTSLLRLVGGGFVLHDARSNDSQAICLSFSSKTNVSWSDQLRGIAYTSVSFPNGTNHANCDNINGSPSDVDVRAALTLYNRIKKRCYEAQNASCTVREQHPSRDRNAKKRCLPKEEIAFDVISDLGTHRRVSDAKSLAELLSIEVEQELAIENPSSSKHIDPDAIDADFTKHLQPPDSKQNLTFFDIRPSESGIICLVSSSRSQQLHAAGRVPCTRCIKWCKGMKGLWWHQLKEHGVDYSNAMEVAAGSENELAIVIYQEHGILLNQFGVSNSADDSRDILISPPEVKSKDSSVDFDVDVFDMVKNRNLDMLVQHVANGFRPRNHLDRNGASCLHWAAGCGHAHIVSYLIEQCDCCPDQGQIGKRSFSGRTPLHWASRNGHLNVVEYLIDHCSVDIEAKTLDGTTAFCWAAWQGHLGVMKFLHNRGCNINSLNSFGCNALLWCSQGAATPEILSWLHASGADFSLVNDNGHSALHKAAQRGNALACKWLVEKFLIDTSKNFDGFLFVGPDAEGACPSDLCGMNGHEGLAEWLSKHECDYVQRHATRIQFTSNHATGPNHRCRKLVLDNLTLPHWLQISSRETLEMQHDNGGISRMSTALMRYCTDLHSLPSDNCLKSKQGHEDNTNIHDID